MGQPLIYVWILRKSQSVHNVVELVTSVQEQRVQNHVTLAAFPDTKHVLNNFQHTGSFKGMTELGLSGLLYDLVAIFLKERIIYMSTQKKILLITFRTVVSHKVLFWAQPPTIYRFWTSPVMPQELYEVFVMPMIYWYLGVSEVTCKRQQTPFQKTLVFAA